MIERARTLWAWTQRTRPWRTFSHFTDVGGGVLSAGMSYQALFAVFAGLWVGFGAFGIFLESHPELLDTLVNQINAFIPGLLGDDGLVETAVLLSSRALSWTSIVAAVSLLWVMINWFTGTRRAIRIIFGLDVKQYRNPVVLKLRDLSLALVFGLAVIISATLTLLSSNLVDAIYEWLGWDRGTWLLSSFGSFTRYAALYAFDVLVLMAMHRFLAEVRVGWRRLAAGSALGGAALLGLKMLGTALLGGATTNPLLASFAVLVGLLIWFNLICRALLLTASWIATGQDRRLGATVDVEIGPRERRSS